LHLWTDENGMRLSLCELEYSHTRNTQNLYITSSEEIKEDNWGLSRLNEVILFGRSYPKTLYKKIILTTDPTLIADGVQAIDDEFLEWFVKNSSCEFVEVINEPYEAGNIYQNHWFDYYKIIIPQEEQKQHLINMMQDDEELGLYEEPKQETKDIIYWQNNCEEDYLHTPISVLRYISELEKALEDRDNKAETMYSEIEKATSYLGFRRITSKELNNLPYQPFITDENGNIWIIGTSEFLEQFKKK
jgi:hypothetical protein